jgi:hypothetical protein
MHKKYAAAVTAQQDATAEECSIARFEALTAVSEGYCILGRDAV